VDLAYSWLPYSCDESKLNLFRTFKNNKLKIIKNLKFFAWDEAEELFDNNIRIGHDLQNN
jgi:hypothetical protein